MQQHPKRLATFHDMTDDTVTLNIPPARFPYYVDPAEYLLIHAKTMMGRAGVHPADLADLRVTVHAAGATLTNAVNGAILADIDITEVTPAAVEVAPVPDEIRTAADLAASLRHVAGLIDTLGDRDMLNCYVDLGVQVAMHHSDAPAAARIALVDALAVALTGSPAELNGTTHQIPLSGPRSRAAGITLSLYAPEAKPDEPDERDAEIARLKAELHRVTRPAMSNPQDGAQ